MFPIQAVKKRKITKKWCYLKACMNFLKKAFHAQVAVKIDFMVTDVHEKNVFSYQPFALMQTSGFTPFSPL